jgi:hypothetical protein
MLGSKKIARNAHHQVNKSLDVAAINQGGGTDRQMTLKERFNLTKNGGGMA